MISHDQRSATRINVQIKRTLLRILKTFGSEKMEEFYVARQNRTRVGYHRNLLKKKGGLTYRSAAAGRWFSSSFSAMSTVTLRGDWEADIRIETGGQHEITHANMRIDNNKCEISKNQCFTENA